MFEKFQTLARVYIYIYIVVFSLIKRIYKHKAIFAYAFL